MYFSTVKFKTLLKRLSSHPVGWKGREFPVSPCLAHLIMKGDVPGSFRIGHAETGLIANCPPLYSYREAPKVRVAERGLN